MIDRRSVGALLLAVVATACTGETQKFETPDVAGPARIQMDVVADHARSFDEEVPQRVAGSQEEQAAAAYLTGTLQQNGYFVRLESVPVADVVRSTNLIAEPAGAPVPQAMVVVPYGTDEGHPSNGLTLGLFLELARALNVEIPEHAVHFVALGAEYADVQGGALGSRRLTRFMLDEGWSPLVIQVLPLEVGESVSVSGDRAQEVVDAMTAITGPFTEFDPGAELRGDPDVFAAAGFEHLLISGDAEKVGEVLLEYLRRFEQ